MSRQFSEIYMLNLAGVVLDFTDDPRFSNNAEFKALLGGGISFEKLSSQPSGDFALVLRGVEDIKRYPIFNKTACATSAAYFQSEAEKLHPVFRAVAATYIKQACADLGLVCPVKAEKYASAEVKSNTVQVRKMGAEFAVEPFNPLAELEKMAQWWILNEQDMTLDERNQKADFLVKNANALDADIIEPRILRYSTKPTVGQHFKIAVENRAKTCDALNVKEGAAAYRELVKHSSSSEPRQLVEQLFVLDKKYGMERYYLKVANPYLAAYDTPTVSMTKQADDREEGLAYKLQTIALQHKFIPGLSEEGATKFRTDPVGTFQILPKVLQNYILAKFDAELRKAKNSELLDGYSSVEDLERRTENLKKNDDEYGYSNIAASVPKHVRKRTLLKVVNVPAETISRAAAKEKGLVGKP